jgi:DNA-binding transcriptional regulator YhcF (GntR family)
MDTSWFATFRNMFLSGTVAKIGTTAYGVYSCIKAHADFNDGLSIPSQKDIAEQTGHSERQVQLSLKVLEREGLIVKSKEWKRNVYRLKEKIVLDDQNTVITWDHLPAVLKKARQELHNYLQTGDAKDAKIIHIEKLELTINLVQGDLVQGDQVKVTLADLERISDLNLREKMRNLLSHAKISPEASSSDTAPHPK